MSSLRFNLNTLHDVNFDRGTLSTVTCDLNMTIDECSNHASMSGMTIDQDTSDMSYVHDTATNLDTSDVSGMRQTITSKSASHGAENMSYLTTYE
ncbi:hypothetical protein SDJN03_28344, partial [Cucurbita argyrosperma subsp. sororia]